jgi:hypothetical protein
MSNHLTIQKEIQRTTQNITWMTTPDDSTIGQHQMTIQMTAPDDNQDNPHDNPYDNTRNSAMFLFCKPTVITSLYLR